MDSYTGRLAHNYYLYEDTTGQFNPILWDMNMSFGGFRFDGSNKSLSNQELQTLSPFIHFKKPNPNRPLIVQLLKNKLYRKIYIGHIRTILNEHFANGKYKERAQQIQQIIDLEVKKDENKLYSYEGFIQNLDQTTLAGTSKIIGVTELMEKRVEYLKNHPVLQKVPPTIFEIRHESTTTQVKIRAKVVPAIEADSEQVEKVYLVYKNSKNGKFRRVEMLDDGSQNDGTAQDQVYGISIEKVPNTLYYIIVEGERSAILSPERASFEFYKIP